LTIRYMIGGDNDLRPLETVLKVLRMFDPWPLHRPPDWKVKERVVCQKRGGQLSPL